MAGEIKMSAGFTAFKPGKIPLKPFTVKDFKFFELRCPTVQQMPCFNWLNRWKRVEKRNFKLYVKRNTASEDLKIIQLFDALDKMNEYDEKQLC